MMQILDCHILIDSLSVIRVPWRFFVLWQRFFFDWQIKFNLVLLYHSQIFVQENLQKSSVLTVVKVVQNLINVSKFIVNILDRSHLVTGC